MSTANVWRKRITNTPRQPYTSCKSVIRRATRGYAWALMIESEVVASGTGRTQLECWERIREAKVKL